MSGIGYTFSFDDLAEKFAKMGNDLIRKIGDDTHYWAQETENAMRKNAHWTDRSGAARRGLFHDMERSANTITARFGHTVDYGQFLELSNGGKYAIVMPTVQAMLPKLEEKLAKVLENGG